MVENFLAIDPATAHPEGIPADAAAGEVRWAQELYADLFKRLGETTWPEQPVGPLTYHWQSARGQSATYLINLAITLKRLHDDMTAKSTELFWDKVRMVFGPNSDEAFEELLVELEVGSELTILSSPVSFESLVPKEFHYSANKPKSPDYGLKYFDSFVAVEVTVWHWETFFAWWRLQTAINETMSKRLEKMGTQRSVRLELPVKADQSARTLFTSRELCSQIAASPSGFVEHEVGCQDPAKLTWQSLETVDDPKWGRVIMSEDGVPVASGYGIGHCFSWSVNPCLSEESFDDSMKSLRKAIDRKRKQAPASGPYLVALSLANGHTDWGMFSPLIQERLWPNPGYKWLSGIIEFTPNRFIPRFRDDFSLALIVNPNAAYPLPTGFSEGKKCIWPRKAG